MFPLVNSINEDPTYIILGIYDANRCNSKNMCEFCNDYFCLNI